MAIGASADKVFAYAKASAGKGGGGKEGEEGVKCGARLR